MRPFGYDSFELGALGAESLIPLIETVGDETFFGCLLRFLHERVGAEHCAILGFDADGPVKVGAVSFDGGDLGSRMIDLYLASYWRLDPTILAARRMSTSGSASLLRLDPDNLPPSGLRDLVYRRAHVSDRLLLCGPGNNEGVSLSIIRSDHCGKFSGSDIEHLSTFASTLLAVVRKHVRLISRKSDFEHALSSVEIIAQCMSQASEALPRREIEVCSRILFGISALGISLDLGIGEQTVKTYRKRSYERLGIATQRELLMWYIRLWGQSTGRPH